MGFCDFYFGRIVDTSEEYIKCIIVHKKFHFFFSEDKMYGELMS